MADQEYSRPVHHELLRCIECSRWWSEAAGFVAGAGVDRSQRCPCGGILYVADMKAHLETIPYVPYVKPDPGSAPK